MNERRTTVQVPSDAADAPAPARCPVPKWGRRLGAAAFLFFLIKGLAWLVVPALIAMGIAGR
ncbi:MAG: hypothetical protein ACKVU4_08265 [Phycisphaerales bacterium]